MAFKRILLTTIIVLLTFCSLIACGSMTTKTRVSSYDCLWQRIRSTSPLKTKKHPLVDYYFEKFKKNKHHVEKITQQSSPFLYHVVDALEKENMPAELALLPMIESEYNPKAHSDKGAVGVWQIVPITAKHCGMTQNGWYDSRKDVHVATHAALKHLNYLYQHFDQDWHLALAAYNCGAGCVKKAIRKNKIEGKPTDYWSLPLPRQTRHYIPKLLALAKLIRKADSHDLNLAPIKNQPHFTLVDLGEHMDLRVAAKLAGVEYKQLQTLNAGLKRHTTQPQGPYLVKVPVAHSEKLVSNLQHHKAKKTTQDLRIHIVRPKDTLSKIALQYKVSLNKLLNTNKLHSHIIYVGQKIKIPSRA